MPRRVFGLMGYVGEAVVEYWLKNSKCGADSGYEIVPQIIPTSVRKKGGGYLDFGVIKDKAVHAVFEVKSQDYIPDKVFVLNPALKAIWDHKNDAAGFESQDGRKFKSAPDLEAYLVLLVCPNKDGVKRIGRQNIGNIILFSQVLGEIDLQACLPDIRERLSTDIRDAMERLQKPTQGKRTNLEFLRLRESRSKENDGHTRQTLV